MDDKMTTPVTSDLLSDETRRKVREEILRSAKVLHPEELALTVDDVLDRALRSQPSGEPVAKPLEWETLEDGKAFRAYLPIIGSIRVEPYGVCGWWEVLWSMPGQCDKMIPDVFDTPDEAKAAAQADYEQRIRSAIVPAGVKITAALEGK